MARASLITLLIATALLPAGVGARPPAHAAVDDTWSSNATAYRGQDGSHFTFTCPKYGTAGSVWGTDVYTDDSSVCTAAVHVGLISLAGGGSGAIEIRPGEASYTGSTRNRITSADWGSWSGSYVIVSAVATDPGVGTGGSGWGATANSFRPYVGARFLYNCPRAAPTRGIWGTDVYTDDSSVCTAAVHAGLIKVASGGKVTIQMLDGQSSYRGSKRNGVASQPYGPWGGSYFVVDAPGGPDDAEGFATGNVLVNGQPFSSGLVPYGATVDVTGGTLSLTAKNVGSAKVYGDGTDLARFMLKKSVEKVGSRKRTTAELALAGGDFGSCGATGAAHAAEAKVVRALWGTGKGRFRTKGRFASATVRGTAWLTSDRCDGTLTTVQQGSVVVRDFTRKKSVTVSAGKSYLAPNK